MRGFRNFTVASAALAFALAILGSWVRINGAGMACPDWPLCRGTLVPFLSGGVVLEWSHRAVALVELIALAGTIAAGRRVCGSIAGVKPTLSVLGIIFVLQVLLGGATVHLANSPISVMLHWGMAMALLATLTTLAVLSIAAPSRIPLPATPSTRALLGLAAALAFIVMCIGAYVSAGFAGLACPTFPDCNGTLLGRTFAQHMQMLHRLAASAFALTACMATLRSMQEGASARAATFALAGTVLLGIQIALGACTVAWQLPVALREAHAANACLTFLAFVVATVLATIDPPQQHASRLLPTRATT